MSIVPGRPRQTSSAEDGGQPKGCEKRTMIDLRPDFYNRIPSWVKDDPRRLHLFLYLLDKIDEDGYAEFSVLGYAKQAGLGREVERRMLANLEKRTNIETICNQRRTIVFICNLERYTMPTAI